MLGASAAFQACFSESALTDEKTTKLLGRALRPFILRRTKAAVAPELPARVEQTLHCELEGEQRRLYEELRDHYRRTLLPEITDDLNTARFRILTALLRLRQAACHPGLIDRKRTSEPSAKLDSLVENLVEVTEAGHKAIVFSQFTSMLAIVRDRLDGRGMPYEYLDGQTRQVIAYRLIAKDTIEDRVLELQERKRAIANAVIGADHSFLPALTREDLDLLLR